MNAFPEVIAVLPAAGIGKRMQTDCPKQYLTIGQKTILEYAVDSLLHHPRIKQIIVVIDLQDDRFQSLALAHHAKIQVVYGGEQRADSVMAGLQQAEQYINQSSWVLIHDAARPCLHPEDLDKLLEVTEHSKIGGILATPVRDTMKRGGVSTAVINQTLERQQLWHALTPQIFPFALLKDCLSGGIEKGIEITDEASALEYYGYQPLLIKGRSDNIKITYPEDLALAEFYLTRRND